MNKIVYAFFLLLSFNINAQDGPRYKTVPGVPIIHSPKTTGVYVGSPSIVIMSNGDYIAAHDFFSEADKGDSIDIANPSKTRMMGHHVYLSKDKGKTWAFLAEVGFIHWAGLFVVRDTLYLLGMHGTERDMVISRSADRGKTWEKLSVLAKKTDEYFYHGSSTPVVFHNGRVYKGYDQHYHDKKGKFMTDNRSFIMSASLSDDLLDPKSWTFSNSIKMPDSLEGTGWLETNAVLGRDNKIKGIARVVSPIGIHAGYYSLEEDSKIDPASVGQIDFIGGATKFNIMWDPRTKKYWSLVNYPSSVVRKLKKSPGGMRSILALTSSKDLKTWNIQSIVLATEDVNLHGFQYVDWQFEGKDIVFVSRTAYDDEHGGATNYHDTNFITFHRIKKYSRSKTPKAFKYLLK
ncbi:MAG: exo-alpha-sialidase [Ferruginibacter sp.]